MGHQWALVENVKTAGQMSGGFLFFQEGPIG
jgi:hypothetical protein